MILVGTVRWVPTTPNEASRLNTPIASLAGGQTFRLQQLWNDIHGASIWKDVTTAETGYQLNKVVPL